MTSTCVPVVNDYQWLYGYGKGKCILFNGYEAARLIRTSNTNVFKVMCKVSKTSLGQSIFTCYAYDIEGLEVFKMTSLKSTRAANALLDRLKICTNKRWSGANFVVFNRADVNKILQNVLEKKKT